MGARSTIESLPDPLREAVDRAIAKGRTIDQIVGQLEDEGEERSRSSVGRYAKNLRETIQQQKNISIAAAALGDQLGEGDNAQRQLITQIFNSLITQAILPIAGGEEEIDLGKLDVLSLILNRTSKTANLDASTEAKIREEERKREREKSVAAAENAARTAGATPETIEAIRRELLGLD